MKIAVDIDDVLADLNGALTLFLAEQKGIFLKREHMTSFKIEEVLGETEDFARELFKEFNASTYMDEVALVEGADKAIKELAKNHELIAITARPDNLAHITQKFIDRFMGHIPEVYFTTNSSREQHTSKGDMCIQKGVDLMIDDALINAESVSSKGIPVLLMDSPWNQAAVLPEHVTRVFSWDEVVSIVNTKFA